MALHGALAEAERALSALLAEAAGARDAENPAGLCCS
jgi:hypothetical protein